MNIQDYKPTAEQLNKDAENKIKELEAQRQARLDFVDAQYYTPTLPQYKDNERYAWAVKEINKRFDEEIDAIKKSL